MSRRNDSELARMSVPGVPGREIATARRTSAASASAESARAASAR